jgi:transcription initiation factor TFIID subunit 7
MNDRLPIRDRTLILRILVPGLEARLRDKMKEVDDDDRGGTADSYLDLEGVTCQPTAARNRTLWNFHCDGATYPATLVNLPCPVELHKTHDHCMYYKCVDVAQMLIVYEDEMALEEAQEKPIDGFPSYYHSGLTPPMKNVVERRFTAREHDRVPPPRQGVADVEDELLYLMEQLNRDDKIKRKIKTPAVTGTARTLEEVTEDIVDYEPWMDDYGRQPQGVEFDADDQICSLHPEVWLQPEDIAAIKEEAAAKKKKQQHKQAEQQKKKKQAEEATISKPKKGIASKKNRAESAAAPVIDDLTLAATSMMTGGDGGDLLGEVMGDDDFFNDLDLEDEDMNFDGIDI